MGPPTVFAIVAGIGIPAKGAIPSKGSDINLNFVLLSSVT